MDLVTHFRERLLIAVPKKGQLHKAALDLLAGCDIQFRREDRLDIALVKNLPISIIFLPDADIPLFVAEGRVSLGITGREHLAEHNSTIQKNGDSKVSEILDLGFGRCKLQVQVPQNSPITNVQQLVGRNLVTSFNALTCSLFASLENAEHKKLTTKIRCISKGSVEIACALTVADGLIDIVGSEETPEGSGLRTITTLVDSSAVLIMRPRQKTEFEELIFRRIHGYLMAKEYVLCQYNIPRSQLAAACKITPGKHAPSITSLEVEGWISVSSLVEQKRGSYVMDELHRIGACDILIQNLANSRAC